VLLLNTPTVGAAAGAFSFSAYRKTKLHFTAVTVMQTARISAIASATQHTPARAVILVVFAASTVGVTSLIVVLILQFGAADSYINISMGYVQDHCLVKILANLDGVSPVNRRGDCDCGLQWYHSQQSGQRSSTRDRGGGNGGRFTELPD